jgi:hypothetical protein
VLDILEAALALAGVVAVLNERAFMAFGQQPGAQGGEHVDIRRATKGIAGSLDGPAQAVEDFIIDQVVEATVEVRGRAVAVGPLPLTSTA